MDESDVKLLVLGALESDSGKTARQLAAEISASSATHFTKSQVNSALYNLYRAGDVQLEPTEKAPLWTIKGVASHKAVGRRTGYQDPETPSKEVSHQTSTRRSPSEGTTADHVFSRDIHMLERDDLSPNDHHLDLEYPGNHVVCSINLNHPYWTTIRRSSMPTVDMESLAYSDAHLMMYLHFRGDTDALAYFHHVRRHLN